jgi:hypothetical protein
VQPDKHHLTAHSSMTSASLKKTTQSSKRSPPDSHLRGTPSIADGLRTRERALSLVPREERTAGPDWTQTGWKDLRQPALRRDVLSSFELYDDLRDRCPGAVDARGAMHKDGLRQRLELLPDGGQFGGIHDRGMNSNSQSWK